MAPLLALSLFLAQAQVDPDHHFEQAINLGKNGPDTAETAARLLAMARDAGEPAGVRSQALIAYARVSRRRHTGAEAAKTIWAMRGQVSGTIDPTFEALGAVGSEALPFVVEPLRHCGGRELRKGRLDDPSATIEIDESMMAGSAVAILNEENPSAPEAAALAPDLVRCLDCGDSAVRQTCARALGRLPKLAPRELAALRKRVGSDRRPDVRALSAALLAAAAANDPASVKALERALADRSETVQLSSANALVQLQRPERARPALQRLARSKDPEIAALAERLLKSPGPARGP